MGIRWTSDEMTLLLKLHRELGSEWNRIAKVLGKSSDAVRLKYQKLKKEKATESATAQAAPPPTKAISDAFGIILNKEQVAVEDGTATAAPSESTLEFLRAKNNQLERIIKAQQLAIGQQQELANAIREAVKAVEPYPPYTHRKKPAGKNPVSMCLLFSDWHIGEVVSADETEGFGEYNFEIAERRLLGIVENQIHWLEVQRAAYPIEEIIVIGLGDYISGVIHQELLVTQEFPSMVQAVKAGHLLGEALRRLSSCVKRLRFEGIGADNHGRLDKKPQAKQKYLSNFSFITHEVAREVTRNIENLEFKTHISMKAIVDINGYKFLGEHGDAIKGWAGLPFYGIARARGREAVKRMFSKLGFHFMVFGHWHAPAWLEGGTVLVNGSLSGTNEYDHSQGRHAGPCQVAFFVHPEHGIFNLTAFMGSQALYVKQASQPQARQRRQPFSRVSARSRHSGHGSRSKEL